MFGRFGDSPKATPEHKEVIEKIATKMITSLLDASGIDPEIVYHYTNANALNSIVKTGLMRGTHIAYMNDASELRHTVDIFVREIEATTIHIREKHYRELVKAIVDQLYDLKPYQYPPIFVTCFSKSSNSLNQWRAYGSGDGGFSIGFDLKEISKASGKESIAVSVLYNPSILRGVIVDLIHDIISEYKVDNLSKRKISIDDYREMWVDEIVDLILNLSAMTKDTAFSQEEEVRIISTKDISDCDFFPRTNLLVPFVPIDMRIDDNLGTKRLPIKELWSGPGRYVELNNLSSKVLLKSAGYDIDNIKFLSSGIQYRVG